MNQNLTATGPIPRGPMQSGLYATQVRPLLCVVTVVLTMSSSFNESTNQPFPEHYHPTEAIDFMSGQLTQSIPKLQFIIFQELLVF